MDDISKARRIRWDEVIFWCISTVVLFAFLGTNALWGSEDRWAEAIREMSLTDDYWHPALNWRIYFFKPQLSYWISLPFAWIFGFNELAVRIPSALAAIVALAGTKSLAKRICGERYAMLAGYMLLGSTGFLFWGRTASSDMGNLAAAIVAVAWFAKLDKNPGFLKYLLLHLIIGLGAMLKGLPSVAVTYVFIISLSISAKTLRSHVNWKNIICAAAGVGIFILPLVLANLMPAAEGYQTRISDNCINVVWYENITRAFNAFDHKDRFYCYVINLPRILIPWSPVFLTALLVAAKRHKSLDHCVRGLLWGIVLCFIMFTCAESRRWYYILPIAPFCIIFSTAICREIEGSRLMATIVGLYRCVLIPISAVVFSAFALIPLWSTFLPARIPWGMFTLVVCFGLCSLVIMTLNDKTSRVFGVPPNIGPVVASGMMLAATALTLVRPALNVFRTEKPFVESIRPAMTEIKPSDIVFYGHETNLKVLFYGRTPYKIADIYGEDAAERLNDFLEQRLGKSAAIICYNREATMSELQKILRKYNVRMNDVMKIEGSQLWEKKGKRKLVFIKFNLLQKEDMGSR